MHTYPHTHIQKVRQRMIEANQVKQDKNKRKQTNKQINEDSEEVLQIRTLCCSYETSKRNGNGIILQKLCVASLLLRLLFDGLDVHGEFALEGNVEILIIIMKEKKCSELSIEESSECAEKSLREKETERVNHSV